MNKNLIYTVAYGLPLHFELVREWALSIRANGFTGDLVLLSDREFEFEGGRTIVCRWMTPGQFWKAAIRTAVNCVDYEKILFVDTDITFLRNPEVFFGLEGIQIPLEPVTITASGLNPVFLTESELAEWGGKPSSNAGTIIMPGKDADAFWTAWENTWKAIDWATLKDYWPDTKIYKGQMYDQGVLQAMIVRGQFPKAPVVMPPEYVGFPCLTGADATKAAALHFCGLKHTDGNKRALLDYMVECRDPEKVAGVCQKLRVSAHPIAALSDVVNKLSNAINTYILTSEARFKALEAEILNMKEPVL
jgi:hypothetical protein